MRRYALEGIVSTNTKGAFGTLLLALTCSMPAYDVQPTNTCNRLFTRSESAPFYHDNHKDFRIGLGVGGIEPPLLPATPTVAAF
jgi:hypothetical protein